MRNSSRSDLSIRCEIASRKQTYKGLHEILMKTNIFHGAMGFGQKSFKLMWRYY